MAVKIGISPIAWQNDDLPNLTAAYTMEQCLREAREIGYTGVERGQRMPGDTDGLRAYLEAANIALCGGWCSGALLENDFSAETQAIAAQVDQFVALNAPCIVYAECSNTVQGLPGMSVNARPKLSRDEVTAYGKKLTEIAKWVNDRGMALAYHHHMGTIIEDEDDTNWLMEATGPEVELCFDTGHMLFGGGDVMRVMGNWAERISHVHYKDIRPDIVADIRQNDRSFLDAIVAGAFSVPGDGCIDFGDVTRRLKAMDYAGWIVVEAEQDPAKAPPYAYSKMGYDHIVAACGNAGLEITT
ncbi:MAG: myo-inosose-2 dehydratase [Pseudomonadota bacterium]